MNIDKERERLSQSKMLESFKSKLKAPDMLTVYYFDYEDTHYHSTFCALIPLDKKNEALSKFTWDLSHDSGKPELVEYYEGDSEYFRYGDNDGIEPFILDREFYDIKEGYKEISEEFRLFHNLYHDLKNNTYLKIDNDGNETLVAKVEDDTIQIRVKELREFLAVKNMYLSIQFDHREHSEHTLDVLKLEDEKGLSETGELTSWRLGYGDFQGMSSTSQSFSRLVGKYLITPRAKSTKEPLKKYIDFIIDSDEDGEDIVFNSNPDLLANFFGANSDAPNYLTPVDFRKSVLDKYFQQPSVYSVEDSYLRCKSLWGLQIDNHHDSKVTVWLGDLGRDLSYNEQLHWRSYNIAPTGGVSKTYFSRQMLAQFTNSNRLEHVFENKYKQLNKLCEKKLSWQLLLPLNEADEHHFDCLRVPSTDEQRDFDGLVLSLTKILIDSLNEKQLSKYINESERGSIKGSIARLEAVLETTSIKEYEEHISFLRKLQNLRSSSTAHRKGKSYKKIAQEFGFEDNDLITIFKEILFSSLQVIEFFLKNIENGWLKKS